MPRRSPSRGRRPLAWPQREAPWTRRPRPCRGTRPAASRQPASSLDTSAAALAVLGPSATLERGYAIVRREPDGSIVRDPAEAPAGAALRIRVAHGDIAATVDDARLGMIGDLLIFVVAVAAFAIVGVVVGMLLSPRLGRITDRMAEPEDEDAGDGVD